VDFRQGSADDAQALIRHLEAQSSLVRSARWVPAGASGYLYVEFRTAYQMVDQSLSAAVTGRSRWDLQLRELTTGAAPSALDLRELKVQARDDLLDIVLLGGEELTAEVSILEQPSRLVVELPGVSLAQAEKVAKGFRPGPVPLFSRVEAREQGGVARLEFTFTEDIDLVDSLGDVVDGKGRVRISVAGDRAVAQARVGQADWPVLKSIEAKVQGRGIDVRLPGVAAGRTQSYVLQDPPRLVVDLPGWRPDQVRDAAAQFKSPHESMQGVRVESTRLGSARLVFDLTGDSSLLGRGAQSSDVYALSLRLPSELSGSPVANQPRLPTSLARRDGRIDPNAPLLVVKPLQLRAQVFSTDEERDNPLSKLYEQALARDPKYASARADYNAALQAVPQARAGVLPTATLDYQRSHVDQTVYQASNVTFPSGRSQYPNTSLSLTIAQPLIRPQAWVKMSQARLVEEQARFNLLAAEQDLMLRLAAGYLNVLAGEDGVELAQAEREATERQHELMKARKATGLSNVSQAFEAEARFAQAKAREREALNKLEDAKLGLKEITGDLPLALPAFKGDFAPVSPQPAESAPWVEAALGQNLALQARRLAVEIAQLEIRRQQAGYLPQVNVTATRSHQETGGSLYGRGQDYKNTEVGVRLTMPIYEGGMTRSLVKEAVARMEKTQGEQEQESRRSERLAATSFNGVQASAESVEALRKAVLAQQSALELREEGFKSGLVSPVQLLDAYRLFFTAKRDFLQARYDYLMNRLKLKQSVGALSRDDLDDLGSLLRSR
jgi:outer membrane protein